MARRTKQDPLPEDFEEHILDTDIRDEMQSSFLEYAYSVIYSRALPDARDGLKPVQRRKKCPIPGRFQHIFHQRHRAGCCMAGAVEGRTRVPWDD